MDNPREVRDDVCAGGMQDTPNDSGMGEDEGQYGPWMVVSKKRPGQKGTKKSTPFEGNTRSTRNVATPLVSDDAGWAATLRNGLPPRPSTGFNLMRPAGLVQGEKDKASGISSSPRLSSQVLLPPKNKSRSSVKGMKVIVRGMGKRFNPISDAASQSLSNTFTALPTSFSSHGQDDHPHGAFNFMALAKPEMDKLSFGKGSQSTTIDIRGEKGEFHQSYGFGQSQLDGGVEAWRSTLGDKRRTRLPNSGESNLGFDSKSLDDRARDKDGCPQGRADSLPDKESSQRESGEDKMEFEVGSGVKAVA